LCHALRPNQLQNLSDWIHPEELFHRRGSTERIIRGLPELYGAPRASASAEESTRMAGFCSTEARIRISTGKSASRQLSVHYERPSMSFVTPSVSGPSARTFRESGSSMGSPCCHTVVNPCWLAPLWGNCETDLNNKKYLRSILNNRVTGYIR
jgi:hypothetical protein